MRSYCPCLTSRTKRVIISITKTSTPIQSIVLSFYFKSQIKILKTNYHILAFDALGHGRSDHPKEINLSKNLRYEIIRDLEDLLQFLDVSEQYGIIGHSLVGGMIGQLFTMKHPEKIKFLLLSIF